MEINNLQDVGETLGRVAGQLLFEFGTVFPLEYGLATLPGPRVLARVFTTTQFPPVEHGRVDNSSQPLPPPPAPRVTSPPPPTPKPISTIRVILERRGI